MLSIKDITIDAELESLLPPLSEDENVELLKSIQRDGFTDPIIVWLGHNILVDGHNRHRIWTTTGMSEDDAPEIIEKQFADRDAVKEWMLRRQLARRNLTDAMRVVVSLKLKPMLEAKAKSQQVRKPKNSVSQLVGKQNEIHVDKEIAKAAGVSHETVRRVETVMTQAPEPIKAAMLAPKSDESHISIAEAFKQTKAATEQPKKWVQGADSVPEVREHAPEDADSDNLFTLKQCWRKTSKKDRAKFLEWAKGIK